jgi:hypothetical protein
MAAVRPTQVILRTFEQTGIRPGDQTHPSHEHDHNMPGTLQNAIHPWIKA